MKVERASAVVLLVLGILTCGSGAYLIFVRPAMLPEDVLFTRTELHALRPEMKAWLLIVFRTWGGFVVGFGLLLLSVSAYLLTARLALLKVGTSLAVLIALGRFLFSNVQLHSDFVWFIGALFAIAVLATMLTTLSLFRPTVKGSPVARKP